VHDVRGQSPLAEFNALVARVKNLEAEVQQLRRTREPTLGTFQQVRWAVTCEPANDEEDEEVPYPEDGATVFPIRFLDAHFVATIGEQDFESQQRDDEQQAVVYSDMYLPVDTTLVVFFQRGGGTSDENDGIWWVLKGPTHYYGKLDETLDRNQSAQMTIWKRTEDGWDPTDAVITVHDWFLRFAEEDTLLEAGTGLRVSWQQNPRGDEPPGANENSGFVVDESSCLPEDFFD
jgi:hypothetical protein